jgi:hypothetical protein
MNCCLAFQKRVPRILHCHAMIASHSIDVTSECREPSAGKCSCATCYDRVNHTHVVWIKVLQACKIPIIVKKAQCVMLRDWIEPSLIPFVRSNVQNFVWFPYLLCIGVPLFGRKLDFLVLTVIFGEDKKRVLAVCLKTI